MSIAAQQVADVYNQIIDDVVENMRQTFLDEGLDESLLTDLRTVWLEKLHNQKTITKAEPENDDSASFYPHDSNVPQTDGACDEESVDASDNRCGPSTDSTTTVASEALDTVCFTGKAKLMKSDVEHNSAQTQDSNGAFLIPQLDGGNEDEAEDEDEDWQEGLDDDDDDDDDDEPDVIIICAFEKIGRTRGKYKAQLKNVILNMDGKDYLFQKALGEWDW